MFQRILLATDGGSDTDVVAAFVADLVAATAEAGTPVSVTLGVFLQAHERSNWKSEHKLGLHLNFEAAMNWFARRDIPCELKIVRCGALSQAIVDTVHAGRHDLVTLSPSLIASLESNGESRASNARIVEAFLRLLPVPALVVPT